MPIKYGTKEQRARTEFLNKTNETNLKRNLIADQSVRLTFKDHLTLSIYQPINCFRSFTTLYTACRIALHGKSVSPFRLLPFLPV